LDDRFEHRGISVRKHGLRWRFKWAGRWRTFADPDDATRTLDGLIDARARDVLDGVAPAAAGRIGAGEIMVAELCEAWFEWKTGLNSDEPIRARTKRDYRRVIDLFITPLIGSHDAALITTSDLKRDFFRVCPSRTGARFSRTVLQQSFRWGIEERLVPRRDNPCTDIQLARRSASDGRARKGTSIKAVTDEQIPTPGEIQKMLMWAIETGRRDWWLWVYIDGTLGLRPAEVCALQREDFMESRGLVLVRRSTPDRSDPDDWHMKTETSRRTLKVGPDFFETIRSHLPDAGWLFTARARGGGLPQRTHTATPCWPSDAPNREMRQMRRAIGLSELYKPYSLRHFVATRLILQGKSEIQVAKFLGTSVEMLQKVYANHLDFDAQRDIGEAVTNLF